MFPSRNENAIQEIKTKYRDDRDFIMNRELVHKLLRPITSSFGFSFSFIVGILSQAVLGGELSLHILQRAFIGSIASFRGSVFVITAPVSSFSVVVLAACSDITYLQI